MRFKTVLLAATVGAFFTANVHAAQPDTSVQGVLKALGASPGGGRFRSFERYVQGRERRFSAPGNHRGAGGISSATFHGSTSGNPTWVRQPPRSPQWRKTAMAPYNKGKLPNANALFNVQNAFNFFAIMRKDAEVDSIGDLFAKKAAASPRDPAQGFGHRTGLAQHFRIPGQSVGRTSRPSGAVPSALSTGRTPSISSRTAMPTAFSRWVPRRSGGSWIWPTPGTSRFSNGTISSWKLAKTKFGLDQGKIAAKTYPGIEDEIIVPFTPCQVVVNADVDSKLVEAILDGVGRQPECLCQLPPRSRRLQGRGDGQGDEASAASGRQGFLRKARYRDPIT